MAGIPCRSVRRSWPASAGRLWYAASWTSASRRRALSSVSCTPWARSRKKPATSETTRATTSPGRRMPDCRRSGSIGRGVSTPTTCGRPPIEFTPLWSCWRSFRSACARRDRPRDSRLRRLPRRLHGYGGARRLSREARRSRATLYHVGPPREPVSRDRCRDSHLRYAAGRLFARNASRADDEAAPLSQRAGCAPAAARRDRARASRLFADSLEYRGRLVGPDRFARIAAQSELVRRRVQQRDILARQAPIRRR